MDEGATLAELQERLGYVFLRSELLMVALIHRSTPPKSGESGEFVGLEQRHNERLEFLGDAVVNLLISRMLYDRLTGASEGELSYWRSALVNTDSLGRVGQTVALGSYLQLGRGEARSGGREKTTILADAMEAVLGAIYLDGGEDAAREVVSRLFAPLLEDIHPGAVRKDYKSLLQERLQAMGRPLPRYRVTEMGGTPHEREFTVECLVDEVVGGEGRGRSKRLAEQDAAKSFWEVLSGQEPGKDRVDEQL